MWDVGCRICDFTILYFNRWLADDEDDGAVIREVFADSEAALLRSKIIQLL